MDREMRVQESSNPLVTFMVRRCTLTLSKAKLKARLVFAISA